MAYEQPGFVYTAKSSGDIAQYAAVKIGSGGVAEVGTAGEAIDGIAQMPAAAANPETIRIMKSGISFAVAGAQIDAGALVKVGTNGKLIPQGGTNVAIGKALTAAGADLEEFSVLLG